MYRQAEADFRQYTALSELQRQEYIDLCDKAKKPQGGTEKPEKPQTGELTPVSKLRLISDPRGSFRECPLLSCPR